MNIALIGMRGTGKTTVGRILAEKLDKRLFSLQEEFKNKSKMNHEKFIRKFGKEKYLDEEEEIIERLCSHDDCIIDTEYSVVLRKQNIINLKKNSLIILLFCDKIELSQRLREKVEQNIESSIYESAADYEIDTSKLTPDECSNLIMHYVDQEIQAE